MIPIDENSQKVPRIQKIWMGDCWKAFVELRAEREDLLMHTVDTDCGCGTISKGKQVLIDKRVSNYHDFNKFKNDLLNIITVEEFKALYCGDHAAVAAGGLGTNCPYPSRRPITSEA